MIPRPPFANPPPVPITLTKLLLVEGKTPLNFFEAFLQHLGISDQIELRDFGGIRELKPFVAALAASAEFKSLVKVVGVVRDAEDDRDAAYASVRSALDSAGLDAANPAVQTAIYILPDDLNVGMIETLCVDAIRGEPVFSCVEEFFRCAEREGATLPQGIRRDKSLAQAYLATREKTQMFPGIAAYLGYWPWDNAAFDDLRQFLESL